MDMKFRPLDDKNHAQKYFSFVFVISKLLKHRWKAKRRAPAFSRALRQINPEAIVHGKFGCRIDRIAVKAGVVGRQRIRGVRMRAPEKMRLQF